MTDVGCSSIIIERRRCDSGTVGRLCIVRGICRITDCGLKTVETREENGCYTVALAEP